MQNDQSSGYGRQERGGGLIRFARRFLRHKGRLALGFCAIPLAQLGDVGITLLIRDALNKIEDGDGGGHLPETFGFILGLAAVYGLFRFAQRGGNVVAAVLRAWPELAS